MEYIVEEVNGRLSHLTITDQGKSIVFSLNTFNRTTITSPETLFENLNLFFKQNKVLGEKVFQHYVEIKNIIDSVTSQERLHRRLQMEIKHLFDVVTFKELKSFILLKGNITMPLDLKDVFDGEKNELTEKLTYLKDDYRDLLVLGIIFKMLVPVFGEYIEVVGKEIGTRFKEHQAFSIVYRSSILSLPAFNRLKLYIDASLEKENRRNGVEVSSSSAIFGGLGSEELPDWLLSRVIVRRIALHHEIVGDSLIANIYYTVTQQLQSLFKTFNGRINEKKASNSGSEEDNISIVETYKVKQTISDGDLAVLSIYTDQIYNMVNLIDPTINKEMIDICVRNSDCMINEDLAKFQVTITQWVLSKASPARGLNNLNKNSLLSALASTQAILWHWGFHELAALLTAVPSKNTMAMGSGSVTNVTKKYVEKFEELYPYHQLLSKNSTVRNVNPALIAINLLSGEMVKTDWNLLAPNELLNDTTQFINKNNHVISSEIRLMLADLILKINEMK